MINNPEEIEISQCVVVDDPPDDNNKTENDNSYES